MSLVLGYATPANAIIMSDGRAVRVEKDSLYSEHYDKTLKVNDNIIMVGPFIEEGMEEKI